MLISSYLRPELAIVLTESIDRKALFATLGERVASISDVAAEAVSEGLAERESQCSTVLEQIADIGIALPHAVLPGIPEPLVAAVVAPSGIAFGPDGSAVHLVLAIFGNPDSPWQHVRMLARLARIVAGKGAVGRLAGAGDAAELFERLKAEDASHG
ncbi:MAG: PTS sugar transporter subunit IIA [Phycisphaerales bacterium]|jgi:mannitol/fructose-specific phosphotransferase system IIA component (Ntr-type)|nr:PTS sugar transporter subunit IIA [Planctomycetota bacterium]